MNQLQTLKTWYEISTDLYRELSRSNLAVWFSGARPSAAALQHEHDAEQRMIVAHDAYLEALAGPAG